MTWKEWAEHYCRATGLPAEMLAEWVRSFREDYTVAEMADAADWLLLNPPAPLASLAATAQGQKKALLDRVRTERARAGNANAQADRLAAEPARGGGACGLCGGTGVVQGLTYTRRAEGGRGVKACCSCRCEAGRRLHGLREEAGFPMLGIDEYEATNPGWRTRKPERNAEPAEGALGGAFEQVIRRAKANQKNQRPLTGKRKDSA